MFLASNQRGQVLWSAKYSNFGESSVQVRVAFSSADSNMAKGQFPCSVGKGRDTFIFSAATLFSRLLFVLLFRLEDISLANSKLQQSLKVKEEKIIELESKYVVKLVKKKELEEVLNDYAVYDNSGLHVFWLARKSNQTNVRRVLVTRNSQCLTPAVRLTVFVWGDIYPLPVCF